MNEHTQTQYFPLVSIIMLSWNRKNDILQSLTQIYNNHYPKFEVIVVDNGSKDGTGEAIVKNFPNVNLLRLDKNIGIEGYNLGVKKAGGKYLLLLDDDSYPEIEAITKMVKLMENQKNISAVASQIINPTNQLSENKLWPESVFTFIGCGALLKRTDWLAVGGYDKHFFLYSNETDLAIRLLSINPENRIIYSSDIICYHSTAAANRTSGRRAFYQLRNNLWIIWKYFSFFSAWQLSVRRIFEEFVFAFTWHKSISSFFRGLFSALGGLGYCLKHRQKISVILQKKLKTSSTNLFGEPIFVFIRNNFINRF